MNICKKLVVVVLCLNFSSSLFAATRTWDGGGGNNNWTTAGNWVGNVVPVAGDDIVFSGNVRTTNNNNFAAGTSFRSITINNSTGNFTINGNSIVLSGGTAAIDNRKTSGTQTINLAITFSTAAPTVTVATGGTLVLSNTINNGGFSITNASNEMGKSYTEISKNYDTVDVPKKDENYKRKEFSSAENKKINELFAEFDDDEEDEPTYH